MSADNLFQDGTPSQLSVFSISAFPVVLFQIAGSSQNLTSPLPLESDDPATPKRTESLYENAQALEQVLNLSFIPIR